MDIGIHGVCYRYPNEVEDTLQNINLRIEPGDIFGLLGPNGAGKTTLISLLVGLIVPMEGIIAYSRDSQVLTTAAMRSSIGYVPQEYAFYPELTPRQNFAYFGAMYNLSASDIAQRSEELMEVLGLAQVQDKRMSTFSGGMKRRVNLAIGILHRPDVLFLDEPTVGVDVQSKYAIVRFLKGLNRNGMAIVYTSHHLAEAEELCNRIALLDHGKVIVQGTLSRLLAEHGQRDLQSLFLALTGDAYRDQTL